LRYFREPRQVDLELIHIKGQALQSQSALVVGAENTTVGFASLVI
jgi:hypothetical protein